MSGNGREVLAFDGAAFHAALCRSSNEHAQALCMAISDMSNGGWNRARKGVNAATASSERGLTRDLLIELFEPNAAEIGAAIRAMPENEIVRVVSEAVAPSHQLPKSFDGGVFVSKSLSSRQRNAKKLAALLTAEPTRWQRIVQTINDDLVVRHLLPARLAAAFEAHNAPDEWGALLTAIASNTLTRIMQEATT